MRLIFFRQGKALAQERRPLLLADSLFRARIEPDAVFSGSAPGMRGAADILARCLNVKNPPAVDECLTDAGYSGWTDLLDENFDDRFGLRDRYDWRERSVLPSWQLREPAKDDRRASVEAFIDSVTRNHRAGDSVVVVTGYGVLRCLGALMRRRLDCPSPMAWRGVDAGNICRLLYYGSRLHVVSWNEKPASAWGSPARTVRALVRRNPSAARILPSPSLAPVSGTISRGIGTARTPAQPGFGHPGRLKQGF